MEGKKIKLRFCTALISTASDISIRKFYFLFAGPPDPNLCECLIPQYFMRILYENISCLLILCLLGFYVNFGLRYLYMFLCMFLFWNSWGINNDDYKIVSFKTLGIWDANKCFVRVICVRVDEWWPRCET